MWCVYSGKYMLCGYGQFYHCLLKVKLTDSSKVCESSWFRVEDQEMTVNDSSYFQLVEELLASSFLLCLSQ